MISIIIPTYNRAHLIAATLVSIQQQSYTNWECIVVDDGSTDHTDEVLQRFVEQDNRIQYYKRPLALKKGPSSCRNYGFSVAKGAYIQFFDSDDIMHVNHLEEKRNAIGENDFVVCKLQEFSGDFCAENLKPKFPDAVKVDAIFEAFVTGEFYMLMMVAPLWKTTSIAPFMPFREDLHILEDHELYARILFHKKNYAIINKELIYYRVDLPSLLNSFYKDVTFGLDSYFEAKKSVLQLSGNAVVKTAIFKHTLSLFRIALAQKEFKAAERCLAFCVQQKLAHSFLLQCKMVRIYFFYYLVKWTKKGDTFFKSMFKI